MIYGDEYICSLCYLFITSAIYLPCMLVGYIGAIFFCPEARLIGVLKITVFFLVLLLVGGFFSIAWGDTMWGRFYYSVDYCGCDFQPFWPMTQSKLNEPWGDDPHGLVGISLTQLNLIWLLFATATWSLTFGIYGYLTQRLPDFWRSTAINNESAPHSRCGIIL